jgi:non-heme chloroperoxidase
VLWAPSVSGLAQTAWVDASPHTQRLVPVGPTSRVEVLDWGGSGRTLVLLAQLGQTAHIYDDWAPTLARRFRVIGITRRGFGESSATGGFSAEELATDIIRVLDAEKLRDPVLVGNQFAGEEMSWIGSRLPDRVAGLVYLDAAYDRSDIATERAIARRIPPRGGPRPEDMASVEALTRWASSGSGVKIPEAEFRQVAQVAPDGRVTGERTPRAVLEQILAGMTKTEFSRLRVPVLAVYATPESPDALPGCRAVADPAVRQACKELFDWTSKRLENSKKLVGSAQARTQVVELPGANAFVFLSNPADAERALEPFVKGLGR